MEVYNMAENNNMHCPYPSCGCVGYAYVPEQKLNEIYCPETALMQGSLFP
ncbi:MAG: spore coat associated protein CotJA, partial [Clostridia bacterium]|nr:spore coat associated protein CotJA [Clostridia bacterium]